MFTTTVKIDLPDAAKALSQAGANSGGIIQQKFTDICVHRIAKYMPMDSGGLIKLMQSQSNLAAGKIIVEAPQANYLYYGNRMAYVPPGDRKEVVPGALSYNTEHNPNAGPYWERRMVAAEGDAICAALQAFIDRGGY